MEDSEIDELMKRHFEAINSKNIEQFMDGWSDDASIEFLLSGTIVTGKQNLKEIFYNQLFEPSLHIKTEVKNEMQHKNYRTYIEKIKESSVPFLEGLEIQWTLEFKDGKISRVWSLQ